MTEKPGTVGLGTYAFFWQWHETAARPLSLEEMIDATVGVGVDLFQICDYPEIAGYSNARVDELAAHAGASGVRIELGTRGVTRLVLDRYLELARALDARLVRSFINTADHRPTDEEAIHLLRAVLPAYEEAGVTLALETYEQVPVDRLVRLVRTIDSPALGICLDPGNCVAALEAPRRTIEVTAPYVKNVHVKDFAFSRREGWVGFTFAGTPLGEGLLDYDYMIEVVRPTERGVNQIIEHWLPWQGDSATTIRTEKLWNTANLHFLRSRAR